MWRPLEREPDAATEAFLQAARATLMPIAAHRSVSRVDENRLSVAMPDGREALVEWAVRSENPVTVNDRAAMRYEMSGQAAIGQTGFGLTGHAVIDVKTRAFFEVACVIDWRSAQAG